jgi:hypothetical protein
MKIGFIFECQPDGPDEKVYRCFIQRLIEAGEIGVFDFFEPPSCLTNLPRLKAYCGDAAAAFLASGCDHVFICWDVYPSHQEERPDCVAQCRDVVAALNTANVDLARTSLLCIHRELEAWLIADGNAIIKAFWKPHHGKAPSISHEHKPDNTKDPKLHINKAFKQIRRGRYEAHYDAEKLAIASDLKRVAKSQSFCRLICKLRRLVPGPDPRLCDCP